MYESDFDKIFTDAVVGCLEYESRLFEKYYSFIRKHFEFDDYNYYDPEPKPHGNFIILHQRLENSRERELEKIIEDTNKEETFSDMLIRLAREKGLDSPDVYKAAGIDAKHYSKIISDRHYQPKKETVFALAIALEFDIDTCKVFMSKAGFAFNHADIFDMTMKFLIESKCYDRLDIDELLYRFGLPSLPQNW